MLDADHGLVHAQRELPIFPLPRTVLLPGSTLPLHVFELRYQEMVRFCREGWELMGIATLKPGYELDYEGRPDVFDTIGVGRIVAFQPLEGGRSNIVLRYVARGRIIEELPPTYSFRRVVMERLHERPPTSTRIYEEVRALVGAIGQLSTSARDEAERLIAMEGSSMLDTLARKLLDGVHDRRRYLELDHIEARGQVVMGALAEVLAGVNPAAGEA